LKVSLGVLISGVVIGIAFLAMGMAFGQASGIAGAIVILIAIGAILMTTVTPAATLTRLLKERLVLAYPSDEGLVIRTTVTTLGENNSFSAGHNRFVAMEDAKVVGKIVEDALVEITLSKSSDFTTDVTTYSVVKVVTSWGAGRFLLGIGKPNGSRS
jgi:hypothetical protein